MRIIRLGQRTIPENRVLATSAKDLISFRQRSAVWRIALLANLDIHKLTVSAFGPRIDGQEVRLDTLSRWAGSCFIEWLKTGGYLWKKSAPAQVKDLVTKAVTAPGADDIAPPTWSLKLR